MLPSVLPLLAVVSIASSCSRRTFESGTVCVCNSTYCDGVVFGAESLLGSDSMRVFYTSEEEAGFNAAEAVFAGVRDEGARLIRVDDRRTYQKIVGFGGAFTDATGINVRRLPQEAQRKLLESYFGEDGIGYSLCRVPLGGTDFSTRAYSYDDVEYDISLKHFQLQPEDHEYKIPLIRQALNIRGDKKLRLFNSYWTAPVWMKTYRVWNGYSMLLLEYKQLFAEYIKRFLDEYKRNGISFWGITTGNEPLNGFYKKSHTKVVSMGWEPNVQASWIRDNLGPTLRRSTHKDIKIILHDEGLITLPYVVPPILEDNRTLKYVDGVATHWYWDEDVDHRVRDLAKTDKKDTFLVSSEACYFQTEPLLGSWERAAGYVASIIDHLEYGYVGWVDWNMVLNATGGPTFIDFLADSPVIVSEDAREFYKQPMFYAMGHFSKFVVPDSVLVNVTGGFRDDEDVKTVAFVRPDDLKVVIVFNNGTSSVPIQIEDNKKHSEVVHVAARSISTILYAK